MKHKPMIIKKFDGALEYLAVKPKESTDNYTTIITLHGRGSDYHDLPRMMEYLELKETLIVSPQAPIEMNHFTSKGYAWYDLYQEGIPQYETFNKSIKKLQRFMEQIQSKYVISSEKLLISGFSQGAVMACTLALLEPEKFLGAISLSGYIPLKSDLQIKIEKLDRLNWFVAHGTHDNVIPLSFGQKTNKFLTDHGTTVDYHEYSMGHEITIETLIDLRRWLANMNIQ